MSIAMRPLSQPPFPLERIEELTALMGGEPVEIVKKATPIEPDESDSSDESDGSDEN